SSTSLSSPATFISRRRLSACSSSTRTRKCSALPALAGLMSSRGFVRATRFMNVYEMSQSNNLLDLELPISGLYLPRRAEHAARGPRRDHGPRASGRDDPGRRNQPRDRARQAPAAATQAAHLGPFEFTFEPRQPIAMPADALALGQQATDLNHVGDDA